MNNTFLSNLPDDPNAWDDMVAGKPYNPMCRQLIYKGAETREKIRAYNALPPNDIEGKAQFLTGMLGAVGRNIIIHQPFTCDYGDNIFIGDDVFVNFGFTVLDEAKVTICNHVFIGPHVSIYTACHPLEIAERNKGTEWSESVTICDNVWIGGNVVVCPGVIIGEGCVVGAGAVVTKSLEPNTLCVGNPARPIRKIENP